MAAMIREECFLRGCVKMFKARQRYVTANFADYERGVRVVSVLPDRNDSEKRRDIKQGRRSLLRAAMLAVRSLM